MKMFSIRKKPDAAKVKTRLFRGRGSAPPNARTDQSSKIDPDIARRRRQVAEQRARSLMRRSLMILAVMAVVGGIAWLFSSPYLSVEEVAVSGVHNAAVDEILARHRVIEGRPLAAIRVGSVEEGLAADPWVASASVKLVFPTRVEVYVQERKPAAWMQLEDRWGLLADDGVILDYVDFPNSARSVIRIPVEDPGLGGRVLDEDVLGALRFLEAIPEDMAKRSAVQVIGGDLWVMVRRRAVRLGAPVEVASKAESLLVILDSVPDGVIDVTAPGRPAVSAWEIVDPGVKNSLGG